MWFADLPVAVEPLWQLAQPWVTPEWLNVAFANVVVLVWQVSQGCEVCMWFADLPVAVEPLWHLAQPWVTPEWLNGAFAKVVVLVWHVSQGCVVTT
jgi:hypothetical protein